MKLIVTQLRERSEDGHQNFSSVLQRIEQAQLCLAADDILLLPELTGGRSSAVQYESWVQDVARTLGCHVVGGTHHEPRGSGEVNCGVVVDPAGAIVTRYDKLRPYGIENALGIRPGERPGQFELAGRRVLVLVCSDFWFSGLIGRLEWNPDLVLVSTFSISQRPNPEAARSLWQHMAVSRAYEFGVYVGISDWAYPCEYHGQRSSGVAGLASPRPAAGQGFFTPVDDRGVLVHTLDFARLDGLRQNRQSRAFLA